MQTPEKANMSERKIEIRPMLEEEFDESIKMGKPHYIEGKVKAQGISLEEAKKQAQEEYQKILPDGFRTNNHHFFVAHLDNEPAGYAWFEIRIQGDKKSAWGYDIHVKDEFRRQGIAKNIFNELENELKTLGVTEVRFHVYADNFRAIPLYEQFGFETTNIVMRKELNN